MYNFYLGGMLLPITPAKVTWTVQNQNETTTTVDGLMRSIWKKAGLTQINFDFELPTRDYPYAVGEFKDPKKYLDTILAYKSKKKSVEFIITHGNSDVKKGKITGTQWLNGKYTVEDFEFVQDAENGSDITCTITLQQYQPMKAAKLEEIKFKKKKINGIYQIVNVSSAAKKARSTGVNKKKLPCKYTVKKGDSIAKIAIKFYGVNTHNARDLIMKANRGTLRSKSSLKKGMKITIPRNE